MDFLRTRIQFIVAKTSVFEQWFVPPTSTYCILLLLGISTILYATLSIVRHDHFQSGAFDLGIYDQAVWRYSRFYSPYNTVKQDIILGDHFTITLPLIAPLFWVWDDVRILLIFQALLVSLSGAAMYGYLKMKQFSDLSACILTGLFIYFYGMQTAVFFDFHPVMIGVALMSLLLYLWEAESWRMFALITILLVLTQENMGFALFGLSVIWFFEGKRWKTAVFLGVCGIVLSLLFFQLSSSLSQHPSQYTPDIPESVGSYVSQLVDTNEKKAVWINSYAWFSFTPLGSIGALIAVFSNLSQYFASGAQFSRMWGLNTHHRAILSVFLAAGSAHTLAVFRNYRVKPIFILVPMLVAALAQQYYFHYPLNKLAKKSFWDTPQWIRDNRLLIDSVEETDAVAAQQSLVPHLSHRTEIYLVYPHEKAASDVPGCEADTCWWLDFGGSPDYLLVDIHPGVWLTMTLAEEDKFAAALSAMERAGRIELIEEYGDARKYAIQEGSFD